MQWNVCAYIPAQSQAFCIRPGTCNSGNLLKHSSEAKFNNLARHTPGVDARHIEKVVQITQQRSGRRADRGQRSPLRQVQAAFRYYLTCV